MLIRNFSTALDKRLSGKGVAQVALFPPKAEKEKVFKRDLAYERSEGVRQCLEAIRAGHPAILISGRAGTGKTRLIKYLMNLPESTKTILVGPTGIAAMNVGGATIHRTFQLPFGVITPQELDKGRLAQELEKIDRLVIDEISMARADIIDAIDIRLRRKRRINEAFGGVQVIMVGDFLQLPPVVTSEEGPVLGDLGYQTPYAFSAKALQSLPLKVITLKKVWRQNDLEMIEMLGNIREGRRIRETVDWFNTRCHRPAPEGTKPMLLTPTRAAAERYNREGLEKLRRELKAAGKPHQDVVFTAIIEEKFPATKNPPAPEHLALLPGARVMAVKNGASFVNGSLGTVTALHPDPDNPKEDRVEVHFDGQRFPTTVARETWQDLTYGWDNAEDKLTKEVSGSYRQIPLVLGWATTIHKSQGLTIPNLRIDLGNGAFAPGQLYVALSRVSSLEGLSLRRPITPRDVKVDGIITAFMAWARANGELDLTVVPHN